VWFAFKSADIEGAWHGEAERSEFSITTKDAIKYEPVTSVLVKINPKFYRPAEVDLLLGDSTKARNELKWEPKTSFEQLVDKMVVNDLKQIGL
jgi:GDPmannose 4,6-dehydratase